MFDTKFYAIAFLATLSSVRAASSDMDMSSSSMTMDMSSSITTSTTSATMDMSSSSSVPSSSMTMDMSASSSMSSSSMMMDMSSSSSMTSSSTTMDMSSSMSTSSATTMDMNSLATTSMSSGMIMSSSSMTTSSSGTSTMSMDMSSSSSTSSSSSDDSMDMSMNSYLTPKFKDYPVLFQHLTAKDKGGAFGIFVLIVVVAFVYKFLLFTSWCLEVKWFKRWNPKAVNRQVAQPLQEETESSSQLTAKNYGQDLEFQTQFIPKVPNLFVDFASPSSIELFHDFIRLLLTFTSTMFIYMLMLVTMSFVLTYVFGVILGLALAEVFFNRWKICLISRWDLQREIERRSNCAGGSNCFCGQHRETTRAASVTPVPTSKPANKSCCVQPEKESDTLPQNDCCCANEEAKEGEDANCGCDVDSIEEEAQQERQAMEISNQKEQAGTMDVNLTPAEKFI